MVVFFLVKNDLIYSFAISPLYLRVNGLTPPAIISCHNIIEIELTEFDFIFIQFLRYNVAWFDLFPSAAKPAEK